MYQNNDNRFTLDGLAILIISGTIGWYLQSLTTFVIFTFSLIIAAMVFPKIRKILYIVGITMVFLLILLISITWEFGTP